MRFLLDVQGIATHIDTQKATQGCLHIVLSAETIITTGGVFLNLFPI